MFRTRSGLMLGILTYMAVVKTPESMKPGPTHSNLFLQAAFSIFVFERTPFGMLTVLTDCAGE